MVHAVEPKSDIGFQEIKVQRPDLFIASPPTGSTLSSIERIKKESLLKRVMYAPFTLLNFFWKKLKYIVGNYIFFCYTSCRDTIKWKETKPIFERIYKVIVSRDEYTSSKDQKARFKEALSELSEDALERFKFHIGICRAEMADNSMTDSQKASWYKKNKGNIDFKRDYFDSISGNNILESAVKSFWKEIQECV